MRDFRSLWLAAATLAVVAWLAPHAVFAGEQAPGVRAYRMTFELPGGGRGSGHGNSWGWGSGGAFDRVRGSVWVSNEINDTVTDVQMTIHFFNTRFYREAGSIRYPLGTLGPRQSLAMNYRWDDWDGEKVIPWVEITYRQPGFDKPQRTVFRPYRY